MGDPSYQRDLDKLNYSEVLGEILFDTAARSTRASDDQRMKWMKLKELETQTKERLAAFLLAAGRHARPPLMAKSLGRLGGALLGFLPWPLSMRLLEWGTRPYLKVFERLEQGGSNETKAFFAYVVAHERAIAEFARRESKGQRGNSLMPVTKLLQGRY